MQGGYEQLVGYVIFIAKNGSCIPTFWVIVQRLTVCLACDIVLDAQVQSLLELHDDVSSFEVSHSIN